METRGRGCWWGVVERRNGGCGGNCLRWRLLADAYLPYQLFCTHLATFANITMDLEDLSAFSLSSTLTVLLTSLVHVTQPSVSSPTRS